MADDPLVVLTSIRGRYYRSPGWCRHHQDFAWIYGDGSVACFSATRLEEGGWRCDAVRGALRLPRSIVSAIRKHEAATRKEPHSK